MKPKVLFVLTRPPYPAVDGTRERILGELKALSNDFTVSLLIVTDEIIDETSKNYLKNIVAGDVLFFKLSKIKSYLNSFISIFSNKPLQVAYFYNRAALKWLKNNSNKFQTIHFHTIRFGSYLKGLKDKKLCQNTLLLICFNDAISFNYQDATKKAKGLWRLIYLIETNRVKNYELKMLEIADGFSIVSDRDKKYIQDNWQKKYPNEKTPIINVIRHGVEDSLFDYQYQPETKNLVFIGNLLYPPNRQGLLFFCDNIWPIITATKPLTRLMIIGRGGKEFFADQKGVEILGFVDNPYSLMTKQALFISPADFGAGVPSKSLLAMSLGLPVVSTANNAAGIEGIIDEENICLINYQDFKQSAQKIINLLDDKAKRIFIGNTGRKLASEKYRQSINYPQLKNFIGNQK